MQPAPENEQKIIDVIIFVIGFSYLNLYVYYYQALKPKGLQPWKSYKEYKDVQD